MKYDLIVVGGGPAGMMAAGRAAELGAHVLLLEKNNKPGIKLLLTGKERCNLTNNLSAKSFLTAFGEPSNFLQKALEKLDSKQIINFFEKRGVKTKTEDNNRVFPVSNKAEDVLSVLLEYLKKGKVEILTRAVVKDFELKKKQIKKVILADGQEFEAKNYLIAVGGKAYTGTGSTGDGYTWLEKMGHTIVAPVPALTPIVVKEKFIKDLEGLSLTKVKFSFAGNFKIGEAIFTSNGLSGPAILALSGAIARHLHGKSVSPADKLVLDFFPQEDKNALDLKLRSLLEQENRKQLKNVLAGLLPIRMVEIILKLAGIRAEMPVNEVSKVNRLKLVNLLKKFELEVVEVGDFNKAMMTNGGVSLKEVDNKTMCSKLVDNLYLAGEILDLDGPTGGFNLQSCWSTGYLAGESFLKI